MTDDEILIRSRTELDALVVNIQAAVKVRKRSDFFSWVQGVFQSLIQHEVLVCALIDPRTRAYRMEWMSSTPVDEQRFAALCQGSGGVIHRLMGLWEHGGRQPLLLEGGSAASNAEPSLLEEIRRLQLDNVVAHGVPDLDGHVGAFFSFSKLPGGVRPEHDPTLELVVPYLHVAWLRACCEQAREERVSVMGTRDILTAREIEILNWVEQGKSNGEIGQILSISHLTVKNHVQKILRKLNVQNRAQAVAKGINLNLNRFRTH